MNVFSLLNNFFRENEREKVSSSATKLYFFLIYEANRSYWEGPLMLSVRRLSSLLSLSKNTVSKSLKELEDRGLITCYPREGNGLTANKEDSPTVNKGDTLSANEGDSLMVNKGNSLKADKESSLTAHKEDSLKHPEGGSRKDSLTANEEDSFTADKGNGLTTNKGNSLKHPEGGSRKESFTASVEGKGASSSAFWFADLELSETASRQTRMTASKQMRMEKKEVYDKGESKYAKFF